MFLILIGVFLKDPIHEWFGFGASRNIAGAIFIAFGAGLLFLSKSWLNNFYVQITTRSNFYGLMLVCVVPFIFAAVSRNVIAVEAISMGLILALLLLSGPQYVLRRQLLTITSLILIAIVFEAVTQKSLIATIDQVSGELISDQWLHQPEQGESFMRAKGLSDSPHKTCWTLFLVAVILRLPPIWIGLFWFGILLTGARLPLFGFTVYASVVFFVAYLKLHRQQKFWILLLATVCLVFFVLLFGDRINWIAEAFRGDTSSNTLRAESWNGAITLFFHAYDVIDFLFGRYGINKDPAQFYISPENDWLLLMLTVGVAGAGYLLLRIFQLLVASLRRKELAMITFLALVPLLMMHSFVQSTPNALLFFVFLSLYTRDLLSQTSPIIVRHERSDRASP